MFLPFTLDLKAEESEDHTVLQDVSHELRNEINYCVVWHVSSIVAARSHNVAMLTATHGIRWALFSYAPQTPQSDREQP